MEQLWRDWRMQYIESARSPDEGCIFCELQEREPEKGLVLAKNAKAFALMNLYPYNPGHLMVAPLRHTGSLEDLDVEEMRQVSELLQASVKVLEEVLAPDGFNVGMNLGRVAGAGYPGHLHWHVVPRWTGDANFMPIVGETRVLPQLVGATFEKLRRGFGRDCQSRV